MISMVSAFFSASVLIPFFRIPGMLSLMSGNWVLFQAGGVQCVAIGLFVWSMSSESFLSSNRAWWMKLLSFSLLLVGVLGALGGSPVSWTWQIARVFSYLFIRPWTVVQWVFPRNGSVLISVVDLSECFFHPESSCSDVLLWAPDDQVVCIYGTMNPLEYHWWKW